MVEEFVNFSVIVNGEFHRTDSEFLFDIHNEENGLEQVRLTLIYLIDPLRRGGTLQDPRRGGGGGAPSDTFIPPVEV